FVFNQSATRVLVVEETICSSSPGDMFLGFMIIVASIMASTLPVFHRAAAMSGSDLISLAMPRKSADLTPNRLSPPSSLEYCLRTFSSPRDFSLVITSSQVMGLFSDEYWMMLGNVFCMPGSFSFQSAKND